MPRISHKSRDKSARWLCNRHSRSEGSGRGGRAGGVTGLSTGTSGSGAEGGAGVGGGGGGTHIHLLPLADVAHESWQPQQPHQTEQLGQPQDPQRPAGVQDLEAFREVLKRRELTPGQWPPAVWPEAGRVRGGVTRRPRWFGNQRQAVSAWQMFVSSGTGSVHSRLSRYIPVHAMLAEITLLIMIAGLMLGYRYVDLPPTLAPGTWADKYECLERINSIRESNGSSDSCFYSSKVMTHKILYHVSSQPFTWASLHVSSMINFPHWIRAHAYTSKAPLSAINGRGRASFVGTCAVHPPPPEMASLMRSQTHASFKVNRSNQFWDRRKGHASARV